MPPTGPLILAGALLLTGPQAAKQAVDWMTFIERLDALSQATHGSELRVAPVPGTDAVRIWIDHNEDDTRLYTPAGGQLDADFQVWTTLRRGAMPDVVVLVESRGTLTPGRGASALTLMADGRRLEFAHRDLPRSRSGPLLFLAARAEIPMVEWLDLVTAPVVAGLAWDVPFRLLSSQLELLRAWTRLVASQALAVPPSE